MIAVENPICLLAIEDRPNSFIPIYITDLGLEEYQTSWVTLKELDEIFIKYEVSFLKEKIKSLNIISEESLKGDFVLLVGNNKNRTKLPTISKELYEKYPLKEYINRNLKNPDFKNHIILKILNLLIIHDTKKQLVLEWKNENVDNFLEYFNQLSYVRKREIYFILIDTFIKFEEKKTLVKGRKEA